MEGVPGMSGGVLVCFSAYFSWFKQPTLPAVHGVWTCNVDPWSVADRQRGDENCQRTESVSVSVHESVSP
ncbi:hypothetical protein FHW23_002070 [Curtobacterium pusillum]|uniref:Secreted protein n=1 Tax=Curtobacterium pusillum TaxID=69373 RepID=A0AAW3T7W3_9MICO|nr:hypothetical protein [Curtobacterium pusillum]